MVAHFCLNCGRPLTPRVIEGRALEACDSCDFVLWRDPKVVTMVLVEGPGGLVLGRRAIEPGYGGWCLPGGFVNSDEHPADAAARECREEILAEVEITDLLGIFHVPKPNAVSMVAIAYAARLPAGAEPAPGEEMLELGVFAPDALPDLVFPSHLDAVVEWRRVRESSITRTSR